MEYISLIKDIFKKYKVPCPEDNIYALAKYMEDLLEINKSINLTAITDPEDFIIKHYVDSLASLELDEYKAAGKIIDIGTGGGFPGIPLAIYSPEKEFNLLDSVGKKLKVVEELSLSSGVINVHFLHMRAEDAGKAPEYRETFDLCLSRAVSALPILCEYALPLLSLGGNLIAYKKRDVEEELDRSEQAIKLLGGELDRVEVTATGNSLVIINKKTPTPPKYPRKAGLAKNSPL